MPDEVKVICLLLDLSTAIQDHPQPKTWLELVLAIYLHLQEIICTLRSMSRHAKCSMSHHARSVLLVFGGHLDTLVFLQLLLVQCLPVCKSSCLCL